MTFFEKILKKSLFFLVFGHFSPKETCLPSIQDPSSLLSTDFSKMGKAFGIITVSRHHCIQDFRRFVNRFWRKMTKKEGFFSIMLKYASIRLYLTQFRTNNYVIEYMTKLEQLKARLAVGPISAMEMRLSAIPSSLMGLLVHKGEAVRVTRGMYVSTASGFSDLADYETLALKIPHGVFALQTALRLHELTDENPHEICMALRHGFHPPATADFPVNFIYRTEPTFSSDIVEIKSSGVNLRVYSVEQTIADCFQYRNKIGLDVAVSALREAVRKNRIDNGRLWEAITRCRVSRISRPYLEALI